MKSFFPRLFFAMLMMITSDTTKANDTSKVKKLHTPRINLFPLSAIRLHNSEFKNIMDLNHEYLLSIDPDRLASWFRREAGLTPKAPPYPFWESEDVWGKGPLAGHIMGFYLSSMAMMFQSTGDEKIIEKLKYTLSELNACQVANRDGYLLATNRPGVLIYYYVPEKSGRISIFFFSRIMENIFKAGKFWNLRVGMPSI